ncbi:MAG: hypothetical protein IJM73_05505, partial [Spirochaetales bacterium]|nr:hypothetical protein [Spirochaetales bacterium]
EAAKMLLNIAGYDSEENRKERESVNADRRRDAEVQLKMDTMASRGMDAANVAVSLGNEDGGTDVMIYLPQVSKEEDLEVPEDEEEEVPKEGE